MSYVGRLLRTVSNCLTLSRAPLALALLQENPYWRLGAICAAMITDSIDGFLARRSRLANPLGALLDPLMDKFFVYFALTLFFLEGRLSVWELSAMLARDLSLLAYGGLRWAHGTLRALSIQAIVWGKVFTAMQFFVLMCLALGAMIPEFVYLMFVGMGLLSLRELCTRDHKGTEIWK